MTTFLILMALMAGGCLGILVMGGMCRAARARDDEIYTDRAAATVEEIAELKEQKAQLKRERTSLEVELEKVRRFCRHLWVVNRGEKGVWLEFIGANTSVPMEAIKMGLGTKTRKNLEEWEDRVCGRSRELIDESQ